MSETPTQIVEIPELTLMRAKYPSLKQKLALPFPYLYSLVPNNQQQCVEKFIEFTQKLKQKQNPNPSEYSQYLPLVLGKMEGMLGSLVYVNQLGSYFQYQNKDFWTEMVKDKISIKNYGLPKQKNYSIYECKDIEVLKEFYDIEELKRYRKLVKQYSALYKSIHKFVQKFDKLSMQSEISDLYEEYKKVEAQDSKMTKLIVGDKNKLAKINKIETNEQFPAVEGKQMPRQVEHQIIKEDENQKMGDNSKKEELKSNSNEEEIKDHKQKQGKKSKKKTELKQPKQPKQQQEPASSKKEQKMAIDKKQQMMNQYKSLDMFVKKKKQQNQQVQSIALSPSKQVTIVDKTDVFLCIISNIPKTISQLQIQFKTHKKIMDSSMNRTCYVNIIMKRSRLEYYDFQVTQQKANFTDPFSQKQDIRYDDSSDEYSELVADSINEEMVQQQQQQEQEESNSAIVPDSFCEYSSNHMASSSSSDDQQQKVAKPQMSKASGKWFFLKNQTEKRDKYSKYNIICLIEEPTPIMTRDANEQNTNDITPLQKIQMYKQIHGSYISKDVMIKKINTIVDNRISMNKISTIVKDICDKKGNQRILKPEIIKEIAEEFLETNPNLEFEFEQQRVERENARNQELQTKKQERLSERDQKIENLILQYNGQMTTNAILEFLKQNQIKMVKQELSQMIKEKQGEKWETIRNQIRNKKKLLKVRQKKEKTQMNEQTKIKSTHRPIDEILKQNEIDMANRPKKIRPPQPEKQIIDEIEEEYQDPQDDSYSKRNERNKKSKKSRKIKKSKVMMKIDPTIPVRRNPSRNKNKVKKVEKNSKQEENSQQNIKQLEDKSQQQNIQQNMEDEQIKLKHEAKTANKQNFNNGSEINNMEAQNPQNSQEKASKSLQEQHKQAAITLGMQ